MDRDGDRDRERDEDKDTDPLNVKNGGKFRIRPLMYPYGVDLRNQQR